MLFITGGLHFMLSTLFIINFITTLTTNFMKTRLKDFIYLTLAIADPAGCQLIKRRHRVYSKYDFFRKQSSYIKVHNLFENICMSICIFNCLTNRTNDKVQNSTRKFYFIGYQNLHNFLWDSLSEKNLTSY